MIDRPQVKLTMVMRDNAGKHGSSLSIEPTSVIQSAAAAIIALASIIFCLALALLARLLKHVNCVTSSAVIKDAPIINDIITYHS